MAEATALVTGAQGFVGRHLCRGLAARGIRVAGVGHGRWEPEEARSGGLGTWVEADVVLDALLSAGPRETVFHCAGSGTVARSLADPEGERRRTVESTSAVLEYARRSGTRSVVLASSVSVYGSTGERLSDEDAPLRPSSPYAEHKLLAERLCAEHGQLFGIPTVSVRLASVYGPGLRKQLLWDACRKLSAGDAIFSGSGRERRDWLHVDDAVAILVAAAERGRPGGLAVNGGSGTAASVREVIGAVAAALDKGRPSFSGQAREGDPADLVPDVARARSWGWQPRVAWQDGVRAYCRWFAEGAR
jgi:UDP-glucose 4-epimerase